MEILYGIGAILLWIFALSIEGIAKSMKFGVDRQINSYYKKNGTYVDRHSVKWGKTIKPYNNGRRGK